ncbi:hypothetical protein ACFSL4_10170 [Streptomyces caeni]|uniref:Lipoprotein n=1 Tax=Streptomyces caeni TaxID=2307231 RepID=A0ABW4IPQ1_9ACTN
MRPRPGVALLALPAVSLVSLSLSGCAESGSTASGTPVGSASATTTKPTSAPSEPRTPEEFLARAREAMSGQKGWTFTVKGNEGLLYQGSQSTATYKATVRRTQSPLALHSTGTTYTKGVAKPEEVYVVDGTGYVKKGGTEARWKSGALSDPAIANAVEDPVAALDAFGAYAREEHTGSGVLAVTSAAGQVELSVSTAPAALTAVRDRGAVKKAVRELAPTLEKLRAAGITAPEDRIVVQNVEEVLSLDATTYRIRSHRFRCTFLIPYRGQNLRYSQDVTERAQGPYTGTITLPTDVG